MDKHSLKFGPKEHILNYSCSKYHLSRPYNVGEVMALIRDCQPSSYEEWQKWYFDNAFTKCKNPTRITPETLRELGERLYAKIRTFVIPEWESVFRELTEQDCVDYIYNLTINRTYDGYITEKSIVNNVLAKEFPAVTFEESDPESDHAGDIDYIAKVGDKAFGIQIKPVTAQANFAGYSLTERMKASFEAFTEQNGGAVFIVFSLDGEIANPDVIGRIGEEIRLLSK